eukprot:Skav208681  [mRNA]  locus=scaffold775:308467:309246:+ [translate_table: standard]
MKHISPNVKPIDEVKYIYEQSKYEVAPKIPFRALITGPSGCGKSNLLINMILDIYKNSFQRIYIWSPSINVDTIWLPVKKYIKNTMKIDVDKEPCFFEEFNAQDMEKIIDTQHKVIEYQKKHKMKKLFGILCILDDISDDPRVSRHNKLLNSLYVRGRHNNISIITSVQKVSTVPPIIRVNATHLFFFKVRNYKEIEILQDELSAVVRRNNLHESKKMIYNLYEVATEECYNFLYINLLEKDPQKMFMINFNKYLQIID